MTGSPQLSDEQQHRLMADLCMIAQGFHPSGARTAELIADGYVWVFIAPPPKHGLTGLGKTILVSLACQGTSLFPSQLADAANQVDSSVKGFAAGTSFLDELETQARCGKRLTPTLEQGASLRRSLVLLILLLAMPLSIPVLLPLLTGLVLLAGLVLPRIRILLALNAHDCSPFATSQ